MARELYSTDIEAIIRTWYERHIKTESDKPFTELGETVLCRFRDQAKDTIHAINQGAYGTLPPPEQRLADVIAEYRAWQAAFEKRKAELAAQAEADARAQAQAEEEAKAKAEAERLAAEEEARLKAEADAKAEEEARAKAEAEAAAIVEAPAEPTVVEPTIEETPATPRKSKK